MKFGRFTIDLLRDGTFRLDGGAMFGVVPKAIWSSLTPSDSENRILLALDCLLVRDGSRKIILEAGMGSKLTSKEKGMYDIRREGGITKALNELDIKVEDITDVVPSHLHFDHAGSLTYRDKAGVLKATFPNARHHIQKRHFEYAMNASMKDRASFKRDDFEPVHDAGLIDFHDGEWKLTEGIDFFISKGHTYYQQHARISEGTSSFIFCGDLVPTSNHIKLAYNMGYDNYPLENIEEKSKLLESAAANGDILYFYHDPEKKMARIKSTPRGYEIKEALAF